MITLDRLNEHDLEDTFRARNEITVMQWCRQNFPLHWEGHLKWYAKQQEDPSIEMFAIRANDDVCDDELVGVCGLTDIDNLNRRAEFSCYIIPSYQRNGYCTKALIKLFYYGFNRLNLNIIWGETFERNPAFNLFVNKLRMKHEGTRRMFYFKDGEYLDANLVSLTRKEWKIRDIYRS